MEYSSLPLRRILDISLNKEPVKSFGIIPICTKTNKLMLIQRKHSVPFLLLIRMKASFSCIPRLMTKITKPEHDSIKCIFIGDTSEYEVNYRRLLYLTYNNPKLVEASWYKFYTAIPIIKRCIEIYENIQRRNEPSYLWPKGVKEWSKNESDIQCAARELREESGINLFPDDASIIMNPIQYQNAHISREYSIICWIMILKEEIPLTQPEENDEEVLCRSWVHISQVPELLDGNEEIEAFNRVLKTIEGL